MANFADPNKYFFEFMLVMILMVYTVNYFLGKRLNEKYALLWVQENRSLIENEFAHVGISNMSGGPLLDAESANSFKFYASGRINCSYLLASIELKKRQDLLSMFVFNLIWPEKDRVRIEIPIETADSLPFIFAVMKKREAKNMHQLNPDIKKFCKKMAFEELAKQYIVFAESDETSNFILNPQIVSALKKNEAVIDMISFTDLKQPHKQLLKAELSITSALLKDPKEFQILIKMLLYLADQIVRYRMSPALKAKADKERQVYESQKIKEIQKERNEEIQKKLQEKKKEEQGNKKKDEKKEELKLKKKMQRKFVKMA